MPTIEPTGRSHTPAVHPTWGRFLFAESLPHTQPTMLNGKPWTDEKTLRHLYHGLKLSQREIGERLGCSRKTVGNWMDEHDIETRSLSEAHTNRKSGVGLRVTSDGYVVWRSVWEGEEHRVPVHRLLAVAEYGHESVIGSDVHHPNHIPWDNRPGNISLENPQDHGRLHAVEYQNRADAPWRDEETLRELYIGENMNATQVADELGCSISCVSSWLKEHNIKKPWRDEGTIRELRVEEDLSYKEIGERLGCSKSNAAKWVTRHGVET